MKIEIRRTSRRSWIFFWHQMPEWVLFLFVVVMHFFLFRVPKFVSNIPRCQFLSINPFSYNSARPSQIDVIFLQNILYFIQKLWSLKYFINKKHDKTRVLFLPRDLCLWLFFGLLSPWTSKSLFIWMNKILFLVVNVLCLDR